MNIIPLAELAAISSALCWAISPLIAINTARNIGSISFNRWRIVISSILLITATLPNIHAWYSFEPTHIAILFLSGIIGIFLGDSELFAGLARIGPRRSSVIFSTHAPLTLILGIIFLSELPTIMQIFGISLVFSGVVISILYGKRRDELHQWENVQGKLWIGLALVFAGAIGQATGVIIARPVMQENPNLLIASTIRVAASGLCYLLILPLPFEANRPKNPLKFIDIKNATASSFIGIAMGMTFYLYALKHAEAGIVATLSSTTPVLLLPLLWITMRRRPVAMAWGGAFLATIGTILLF